MTDLLEQYIREMETLPEENRKRFKKEFINKVSNDGYECSAPKNMAKLQVVADDDLIVDFMVHQMEIYDRRPEIQGLEMEYTGHFDISCYCASFVIFALSNNARAIDYLSSKVDTYTSQTRPLFLNNLYSLLGGFPEKFAPVLGKIKKYYEQITPGLPSFRWAKRVNLPLPEIFSQKVWAIHFDITTNGKMFPDDLYAPEEQHRHFTLTVSIGFPGCNNSTWRIQFYNRANDVSGRFFDIEKGWFTSRSPIFPVKKLFPGKPESAYLQTDIFNLHEFVTEIERQWNITFVLKPSYISVSKGLNKKKILQWIENKFAF